MRKQLTILTLFFVPLTCIAQVRRIAIYDFATQAVRGDAINIYGDDKKVGGIVANRIMAKLLDASGFEVIDRQQIDNLMKEQNLRFSDRFDPHDAPRLGKILHVDAIVVGSVDSMAGAMKNNRMGIGKLGLGGAGTTAQATVSMRVISTESARVLIAESVNTKGSHSLGKGGSFAGKGGTSDNTVSEAHPEAPAATEALQKAADELAQKIISKSASLPTRGGGTQVASSGSSKGTKEVAQVSTPVASKTVGSSPVVSSTSESKSLKIGRVDGGKVYVIGGEDAGVKVNETFEVRRVTGTMKDDAGGVIETDEKVDTIVITDVEDRFAVGKSTSATLVAKPGDRLKPVKTPVRHRAASPAASTTAPVSSSGLPAPVQRHP